MYETFQAMAVAQGACHYTVDSFPVEDDKHGTVMCLDGTLEVIYVTEQQASEFFGLGEAKDMLDFIIAYTSRIVYEPSGKYFLEFFVEGGGWKVTPPADTGYEAIKLAMGMVK